MRSRFEVGAPELTVATAAAWLGGLLCSTALPQRATLIVGVGALVVASFVATIAALAAPKHSVTQPLAASGEVVRPRAWSGALASGLVVAAALAGAALAPPATVVLPPSGVARLELDVLESRRQPDGSARSLARVRWGERVEDQRPIEPGILVRVATARLTVGTRVRLLGQLSPAVGFRNPSPHPAWPARNVVAARLWVSDGRAVEVLASQRPRALLERLRQHVMDRLVETLAPRPAGVALALVLGEGDAIDARDDEAVRGSGLAHIFAVSGLHVVLVVGALVELLRRLVLRVPRLAERYEARRIACGIGAPLVLVYALFAGGAPSAWRAATTAALGWTLIALGHKPKGAAVAACAVLMLGSFDPREALRPGFLLSVIATSAILAQPPPGASLASQLGLAARLAGATTLATAPLVIWCFGQLPWIGVLANLVLVPVGATVLLPFATLHALIASLGWQGALTARVLTIGSEAFLNTCAALVAWSPPQAIAPPDVAQGIALCAGVLGLFLVRGKRAGLAVVCATALLVGLLEWRLRTREAPRDRLRATFLDVGQGDAALFDLPDGRLLLVDAGGNPAGGPDPGQSVLVPLLQARRRQHVDIAVLTHPHPDHYGGLGAVLDHVSVAELWDSGQAEAERGLDEGTSAASELLARARKAGTRVHKPAELCRAPFRAGGARISVLAPCPAHDPGLDANDNSLVLRIEYAGRSLLLMGDAEAEEEAALLASGAALQADVLKVGHHGSRTSSSTALITAVRPSVAIISAGAANRFGHPHAEVIERLHGAHARVLNLAEVGGTQLTIERDGHVAVIPFAAPSFEL